MIFATSCAAALIAPHTQSCAAPRTIDDCEKIQAADAYNQCLAVFGPVAHTHASSVNSQAGDNSGGDALSEVPATGRAASTGPRHRQHGRAHSHRSSHKPHWVRHEHGRASASHKHGGGGKLLAFNVISGYVKSR
jgi:hypothetical protein